MNKIFSSAIILLILTLLNNLYAKEELTVVQTVSKDRRSFIIAKGIKDGISKGQEVIFANESVSVVCKASEVNRDYSLWIPIDTKITVPFNKEDIVSQNTTVYGNVALDIVSDPNKITPEADYNMVYRKFRTLNNYSLRAGYNRGLVQSSSSVSTEQSSGRSGYAFSLEYNYRFLPEFEMSIGGRIDNEVYRIENPDLDIPTKRIMATMAATYHFVNFTDNKNNYYLSVAAGIGKSETTVDESVSSGTVTVLPEARLGFIMPFSKSTALFAEGSIESINSTESFEDGTEQNTNILNLKMSVGLRF